MSPKLSRRVQRNIRDARQTIENLWDDLNGVFAKWDDRDETLDSLRKTICCLVWAADRIVDDLKEFPLGFPELAPPDNPAEVVLDAQLPEA